MICDFLLAKENKLLNEKAKNLGFDSVFFVKEILTLKDIKKEKGYDVFLLKTTRPETLRRMIDKAEASVSLIFVLGTNDTINRIALEHKKVRALVCPEYERKYDFLHYRNSGLNQVLCKIARDNDKVIIKNFKDILFREGKERALLLGKIMQNIKLCRKYKVKVKLASFASIKKEMKSFFDLRSFCIAIGMTKKEAKNAFLSF